MPNVCPFLSTTTPATTAANCLEGHCMLWQDNDCVFNQIDDIQDHTIHYHRAHGHDRAHDCSDMGGCGSPFIPARPPYVSKLSMEWMCNEDMDGNELVYGYDFGIRDTASKPQALVGMEAHPNWRTPTVRVDWDEILAWYNGTGSDPLSAYH